MCVPHCVRCGDEAGTAPVVNAVCVAHCVRCGDEAGTAPAVNAELVVDCFISFSDLFLQFNDLLFVYVAVFKLCILLL